MTEKCIKETDTAIQNDSDLDPTWTFKNLRQDQGENSHVWEKFRYFGMLVSWWRRTGPDPVPGSWIRSPA